jgi:U4/U6.U5 tri-snRNP-associated protein 1
MQKANKILEAIEAPALQLASDFFTPDEMTFKKRKRKVRKVRKVMKADDLLQSLSTTAASSSQHKDMGSRKRKDKVDVDGSEADVKVKMEPEDMEIDVEIDDLPAAQVIDVSDIKLEDEGDLDFQLALSKARKLKQQQKASKPTLEQMADMIHQRGREEQEGGAGSIVLHATAEFCRTLGDIPSVDGGNLYDDEEMDFETEERKASREEIEERGRWNAVEIDEAPVDITREADVEKAPILEQEPEVGPGIAGALKLAMKKGYLEHEKLKPSAAPKMKHLQAKNYSIEDKNYDDDRTPSKRDMYSGPTTDFKEKGNYKPDFKLEYIDEDGKPIPAKEAFRLLSHKFHGKGSGKNKIDKKRRKFQQEKLMQHMNSTDTPLGTLELLQQRQKSTHMPYIVMSGSKASQQSTSLSKSGKR